MTIGEFCRRKTQAKELCVIRDCGYITTTAWIDYEDLFSITPRIRDAEVKSDEWGTLSIVTEHGDSIEVPCHYIDC